MKDHIEVLDFKVQIKLSKLLFKTLFVLWFLIIFVFIINRFTQSFKDVQTEYLEVNFSDGQINTIQNISNKIDGDSLTLQSYIISYVIGFESYFPNGEPKKDFLKLLSSSTVWSSYQKSREAKIKNDKNQFIMVQNPSIKKQSEGLYKVTFNTVTKYPNNSNEYIRLKTAFIRYHILKEYEELDLRTKITNYQFLNPLKIEIINYNSAIHFKETK